MRSASERACEYRDRAEEMHRLVGETDEPFVHAMLVRIAEEYRALADELGRENMMVGMIKSP